MHAPPNSTGLFYHDSAPDANGGAKRERPPHAFTRRDPRFFSENLRVSSLRDSVNAYASRIPFVVWPKLR